LKKNFFFAETTVKKNFTLFGTLKGNVFLLLENKKEIYFILIFNYLQQQKEFLIFLHYFVSTFNKLLHKYICKADQVKENGTYLQINAFITIVSFLSYLNKMKLILHNTSTCMQLPSFISHSFISQVRYF
jgi:hypothetical protein